MKSFFPQPSLRPLGIHGTDLTIGYMIVVVYYLFSCEHLLLLLGLLDQPVGLATDDV